MRACYVKSSCVVDFIDLLDTFCNWRKANNVGGEFPNITLEVNNATGMVFDVEGKEYDCAVTWQVAEAKVQLGIFKVPSPVWTLLYPVIEIQKLDSSEAKVRFEGDTLTFKGRFSDHGVPGRHEDASGNALPADATDEAKRAATYVRIIKAINVSENRKREFMVDLLKTSVYRGRRSW